MTARKAESDRATSALYDQRRGRVSDAGAPRGRGLRRDRRALASRRTAGMRGSCRRWRRCRRRRSTADARLRAWLTR